MPVAENMMTDIGEAVAAEVQQHFKGELQALDNTSKSADKLTQGILQGLQPSLEQIKHELDDLLKKQNVLIGKMQLENNQLEETADNGQCHAMYSTIKLYQEKLSHLKREMTGIHDRTTKLKKRASRLQQIQQKRHEDFRHEEEVIVEQPTSTHD